MKTIEIPIPEELVNVVLEYHIESESRKNIILTLLRDQRINLDNERFQKYQEEYEGKNFVFEALKKSITECYVKPIVQNEDASWILNYSDNILYITYGDNDL